MMSSDVLESIMVNSRNLEEVSRARTGFPGPVSIDNCLLPSYHRLIYIFERS